MKRVLITGASGFIGRQCLPILVEKNYEVYAGWLNNKFETDENVNWINFDIHKPYELKETINSIKPTHLLHLAWYTEPNKYVNSSENIRLLKSSVDLVNAFIESGGERIVTSGSCFELYSNTLYGACKSSLSKITSALGELNSISTAHGRLFYLYGPYENKERVIPYVINKLLAGEIANCSRGEQIKDYIHVFDAANAFVSILDSNVFGNIDIGRGKGVKLKDIFTMIESGTNTPGLIRKGGIKVNTNEPMKIIADSSKLIKEVGWRPKYNLENGIKNTLEWWEENGVKK